MKEISREFAKYLFKTGEVVYCLYNDGTECVAGEYDLTHHDGIFGVETE